MQNTTPHRGVAALACAAVLVCWASGCAYYKQADGEKLANEVYGLNTQIQALKRQVEESQKDLQRQDKQLAQMTETLNSLNTTARRNDADFGAQLDEALQEVARMKGLVEPFRERLDNMESKVNKVGEEIDVRVHGLEEKSKIELAKAEDKMKAEEEAARRARLLANPSALMDEVVRLVNGQHPADARKLLREFSVKAASDPSLGKQADVAQYFLAETYFLEANYQAAATEFNTVRKNFPKSAKVPDALVRMGECFEKLNLPSDAKIFYKSVLEKHPKSEAAKRAKEHLAALK
jgi:TolA-binding protein